MMRAIRRCGFILLMWAPLMSHAGTISTTEIVSQTTSAALSCMRWMPVGMCFGCAVPFTNAMSRPQSKLAITSRMRW